MQAICPKCGEFWDHDTIHDIAELRYTENGHPPYYASEDDRFARNKNTEWDEEKYGQFYKDALHDFQMRGCVALLGTCSEPSEDTDRTFGLTRQEAASALYEVLGDDMDGAMAELEDLGW